MKEVKSCCVYDKVDRAGGGLLPPMCCGQDQAEDRANIVKYIPLLATRSLMGGLHLNCYWLEIDIYIYTLYLIPVNKAL